MTALDDQTTARITDAVHAGFDPQTKFLADFVAIPSLRFEEGPAQDFIAAALRARAYKVDDWTINLSDLEHLPGFGPIMGTSAARAALLARITRCRPRAAR